MPKQNWTRTSPSYYEAAIGCAEGAVGEATGELLSGETDHTIAEAVVKALSEWGMIPLDLAEPPERFPKLVAAAAKLGPNALAVLEEIAERLSRGASMGDFDNGRDMARESFEEMLDRLVYEIVRRQTDANRQPVAWLVTYGNGNRDCIPANRFELHATGKGGRVFTSPTREFTYSYVTEAMPLYADSVPRAG
jgi:hypothetical protein